MNILLVSPEFPDTFWSFKHALKFIRKSSCLPPLGLLTVAAMLPAEWNKRLADQNVSKLKKKDLEWADYAFISAMVVQREPCRRIIARCKEAGVKVVAGGPLFTGEHAEFEDVDHFVLNEAEITLPRFLDDLERGDPKKLYETDEFPDIDNTPVPLWELADLKKYATTSLQYSRGCPFNCDFCNITSLFGHKPRTKAVENVIAELDKLHESGWRGGVFFVDDNFIGNKRRLKTILMPALIEWRRNHPSASFITEVSIDLADDQELMDMMAQAGFDTVFVGIETPCEEGLAECSKTQNRNRDLVADVKKMQRAGLQVQGGFILGFDSDAPSIFDRQIEFIQKSGIVTAMVGILQALPGTKLFDRLHSEGRMKGWSSGDNVDGSTNIITWMSSERLYEGYHKVLSHIYSPKYYYERVITFLKEFRSPTNRSRPQLRDVMAFARSLYRIGIFGKERFHYWKLLAWTTLHRPKLFREAVTLAIYGRHFRVLSERIAAPA